MRYIPEAGADVKLPSREVIMEGEDKARLQQLCEQAANERDAEKLTRLIQEINELLERREKSLRQGRK
jgi:hypothetical protein